ncbi:MAG: adenylate/guanylate cyclase domain-containing protein [Actinomycetota bacterium]|nr:adenylate/guanylate cyclase domain-containing protein [Actinomycetota bacterium]
MTAIAACQTCGTEPLENARFCHGCGSPVKGPDVRAEYKQVTVLFADVVHSMDIAAAVGAERLREIMADVADLCAAVVQRFGGTVDKFTGDGIMAVFGAPVALEDHAVRACLAALGVQEDVKRLAVDVDARDGVHLQLRVGLNSGQVIAGEIGSGPFGYTAIGEQVGMAQRMESAAPPGGVMLSAPTARLVEGAANLGGSELVRIKGSDTPVPAHRLLGMGEKQRDAWHGESKLIGRGGEMSAVEGLLERALDGHGAVVGVAGPPGIGKSRLVRDVSAMAAVRGADVFVASCESHTSQIPFYVVGRLLRAVTGIKGLDPPTARARIRGRARHAEPEDLLLLNDLLGIADPDVELPKIDPEARRRRLTGLVNAASLARETPALFVIEDAHWIDEVSESLLTDFIAIIPRTPTLVLVTYRPEYRGALGEVAGARTIALSPLSDSETAGLVSHLLGAHPSVAELATMITERAAGNPFFAEEIVRELADRGVLQGNSGAYVSTTEGAAVRVPATLQATIAARIDRLGQKAKRTLGAAAVIGSNFNRDLLETLGIEPVLEELVSAQLINQMPSQQPEYAFYHPLIREVAYESQLRSDRAELHRRIAAAIESRAPGAADEHAALIAGHLEAAGDEHGAYGWHMRAAAWATNRDIAAAWLSWERARTIADALPADDPNRVAMRIAPRTMLCGIAFRVNEHVAGERFDEFRELCATAGDKPSLAIGMVGLVMDYALDDRRREASQVASEAMALIESIDDPTLTVGLSVAPIFAKGENVEYSDVLRWSQRVIDLAAGDPTKGNFIIGSPLALALTNQAIARYALGRDGWREGLEQGLVMARSTDPMSYVTVVAYVYFAGIAFGAMRSDDRAVREIENSLEIAERSGDDMALAIARMTLGVALVHRGAGMERDRGHRLLTELNDGSVRPKYLLSQLSIVEMYVARERARHGDRGQAIPLMQATVDHLFRKGLALGWGLPATGALVEALLDSPSAAQLTEAEAAVERLAAEPAEEVLAIREVWVLRLRALLARARGEDAAYQDFRDRYRAMAHEHGYDGHIAWAAALP